MPDTPYRASEQPTYVPDPYLAAWAAYRRRRAKMWTVFFTWPLVAGVVLTVVRGVTGATEKEVFPYVAIPIGLVAFVALNVLTKFDCPRCGNPFHRKGALRNGFARRCLNCDIRIGTPLGSSADEVPR